MLIILECAAISISIYPEVLPVYTSKSERFSVNSGRPLILSKSRGWEVVASTRQPAFERRLVTIFGFFADDVVIRNYYSN